MRINILIVIALTISLTTAQAQNLIQNGGFESFDNCPTGFTQWNGNRDLLPNWNYPTKGTPDYFNICSTGTTSVPSNFAGYMSAKEGNGYVGIMLKSKKPEYREYLQTKISQPLIKGEKYCLSFYYALAERSSFTIDSFGVTFRQSAERRAHDISLGGTPQFSVSSGNAVKCRASWTSFCHEFVATGKEQYLLIGNFTNDKNTNVISVDVSDTQSSNIKQYAYFYIDEVKLVNLAGCNWCTCNETNRININFQINEPSAFDLADGEVTTEISGGTQPYVYEWSTGDSTQFIEKLYEGDYTLKVTDIKGCSSKNSISVLSPVNFIDVLASIDKNVPLSLNEISFEFNKSELSDSSFNQLNMLMTYLMRNATINVQVIGYTDSVGDATYNLLLSEKRAKSVVKYLEDRGIEQNRLSFNGMGEAVSFDISNTSGRKVEIILLD